ncbi:MAG: deoxyhypusine synthase [Thermoplasmata archaeon]
MRARKLLKGARGNPPVRDIRPAPGMSADAIVRQMEGAGGFTGRHLAEGVGILEEMVCRDGCLRFLSFPACIVATGCRGILADMVRRRLVDVIVTTCGTIDHDLARAWGRYYHGDFEMDDASLRRMGINRLGNVLVPDRSYGTLLERRLRPMLGEIYASGLRRPSTRELIWAVGERVRDEGSILHWAARNRVPVFVPGITDGAFGCQLWMFWQEHRDFSPDPMADEQELSGLVMKAESSGALIIGGGISKHHVIWWNQFRGGLDYAIYITTATEQDGSLSGARVREAISWGKVRPGARRVNIEADATAVLPLMYAALLERLEGEHSGAGRSVKSKRR